MTIERRLAALEDASRPAGCLVFLPQTPNATDAEMTRQAEALLGRPLVPADVLIPTGATPRVLPRAEAEGFLQAVCAFGEGGVQ